MDLLEPYMKSGLGIALKASNGKFWTRWGGWEIRAAKENKDPYTKFDIIKVDNNTIRLKNSDNEQYLTRWSAIYIYARKASPDIYCNFLVYEVDGKLVLKNVSNGKFVARYHYYTRCLILKCAKVNASEVQ